MSALPDAAFRVEPADYAVDFQDLRAVREPVFVVEQKVPLELEWDELDGADPKDFTVATVPARLKATGDPWADMHASPGSIEALLGWWERDVAAGLGELPFPPDFPKMPGEPPRVQPSRARSKD